MSKMPTIEELNKIQAGEVALLMLRCLATSDLTFMCSLFKPETLKDIKEVTKDLISEGYILDTMSSDQIEEAQAHYELFGLEE